MEKEKIQQIDEIIVQADEKLNLDELTTASRPQEEIDFVEKYQVQKIKSDA